MYTIIPMWPTAQGPLSYFRKDIVKLKGNQKKVIVWLGVWKSL